MAILAEFLEKALRRRHIPPVENGGTGAERILLVFGLNCRSEVFPKSIQPGFDGCPFALPLLLALYGFDALNLHI
ncbi:hypothetical protein [Pseudomonas aeruginosa]|uniref:hypothetical protein n=1 Tax=Pseudomonas aeruginosa TaxID=287 RepID=UPI0027385C88|nr:hypothetical protein [Pseudomonas aeruginosa]